MKIKTAKTRLGDKFVISHSRWTILLTFWTLKYMEWGLQYQELNTRFDEINNEQITSIYTPWIWIDFVEKTWQ